MINVILSINPSVIEIPRKQMAPLIEWVGSERKKLNLNTIFTSKALRMNQNIPAMY